MCASTLLSENDKSGASSEDTQKTPDMDES